MAAVGLLVWVMIGKYQDHLPLYRLEQIAARDIDFIARSNWLCFTPRFSSQFIQNINRKSSPMVEAMLGLSGTID
ncbi:IS66 family transposase [Methylomonas methanica]|uniref:IS66 family transposase n=1 Tax=Methylomonas methanica TaxID=421 RepID=UPI000AE0F425